MSRSFPFIEVTETSQGFQASCALAMNSILHGSLACEHYKMGENDGESSGSHVAQRLQQRMELLLNSIRSWSEDITLEIHLSAMPDLKYRAQGRLFITIILLVKSLEADVAREITAQKYLALKTLLGTHMPDAEFVPVASCEDLLSRRQPFTAAYSMCVHRKEDDISLAVPILRKKAGFGSRELHASDGAFCVRHTSPWLPSYDNWSTLLDTIMGCLDSIQVIIRLKPCAFEDNLRDSLLKTISMCEEYLSGGREFEITFSRQVTSLRDAALYRMNGMVQACFRVGVFLLSPYPLDSTLGNILGQSITAMSSSSNEMRLFFGDYVCSGVHSHDVRDADYFHEKTPMTTSEAACAFRLPYPPFHKQPGLKVRRSRTRLAIFPYLQSNRNGATQLFFNEHAGMRQPVNIDVTDRMRHTFMIGQTGTGKSTLMESLLLQDIRAGRGVALIDPHGDLVDSILGKIPKERHDDVVLFDTCDRDRPLGFNILDYRTVEERDLIIDELYLTLDQIYDMHATGGPIFESNYRGMMKLLLSSEPREGFSPTLLDFPLCYVSRQFRNWLYKTNNDSQVKDFIDELERTGGDVSLRNLSPYITSKFSRFIHDTNLKRIIGQDKTSFDIEKIMNEGKIFLVKLNKGRFGSVVSALLANQLVSRFKMAAMKRGEMKPSDRRDFFLYVDEAHNLPGEDLMQLLSEARKFRLGLILVTQYASQLSDKGSRRNNLLSAVLGNVGTIVLFRLGREDAKLLEPVLYPYFTSLDIIGLSNWKGYARMQISNDSMPPFSFTSYLDPTKHNEQCAQSIRELSKIRYGLNVEEVDAQIEARRTVWKEQDSEKDEDEQI